MGYGVVEVVGQGGEGGSPRALACGRRCGEVQVVRLNRTAAAFDQPALDDIFELADIAGEDLGNYRGFR